MNYPVWNVPLLGSGLVVATIAIIHVLISHLAVGGGAFLAVAEVWSDRQADGERVRLWLHKFATFFLVFTTVFGAITGVGIWFSIQLASPEATSLLIHQFAFAWATEWVAFLVELSLLYLYYYGWSTNSRKLQRLLAIAYFGVAWLSLFIINGILTFMLTPGNWTIANLDIAAGFFNPGFWPALCIRTLAMLVIAGLAAILVASRIEGDSALKERIVGLAAKFVLPGALLVPFFVLWYWSVLPESAQKIFQAGQTGVASGKLEAMARHFWLSVGSSALIVIGVWLFARKPRAVHFSGALALFLVALFAIMGAEFFREMARKPFVVHGVMYANALWKRDADNPQYMSAPYLEKAKWAPAFAVPRSAAHGEWIYRLQCASCHTLDGYRSLGSRTASWSPTFGVRFLEKLDAQGVMPRFQGSLEDRAALTAFFLSLPGKKIVAAEAVLAEVEKEERDKAAPNGTAAKQSSPSQASSSRDRSLPPAAAAKVPLPSPDPLGYPAPAYVIQALAYLTLALHLLAMSFTLGGLLLLIWSRVRGQTQAAQFFRTALPLGFSYLVTFGVPPLLFLQVLYGQLFYSSSVLVGAFWISVVFLLIAAYALLYAHKLTCDQRPRWQLPMLLGAVLAMLAVAFIYVNNLTLSMAPERWALHYAASPAGTSLNLAEPVLWPRFLTFVSAPLAVAGLALVVAGTLIARTDRPGSQGTLWLGLKAHLLGRVLTAGAAAWLLFTLPQEIRDQILAGTAKTALLGAAAVLAAAATLLAALAAKRASLRLGIAACALLASEVGALVALRDSVRGQYLASTFELSGVPVQAQWGMLALFGAALLVGLVFTLALTVKVARSQSA